MEKDISCKHSRESISGYINIRYSGHQSEENCRDREGDYIVIKSSNHQEGIATLNMQKPNNRAAKHVRQQTNRTE